MFILQGCRTFIAAYGLYVLWALFFFSTPPVAYSAMRMVSVKTETGVLAVHAVSHKPEKAKQPAKSSNKFGASGGWRSWFAGARKRSHKPWQVMAGATVVVAPKYEGQSSYRVLPLPFVDATYKRRWFISTYRGVGGYLVHGLHTQWGLGTNYNFRSIGAIKNKTPGFSKIYTYLTASSFLQWRWRMFSLRSNYEQAITRNYGGVWRSSLGVGAPLSRSIIVTVGPVLNWATARYLNTFYGVDDHDAKSSGLSVHHMHAGIMQLGLSSGLLWFHGKWFAQAMMVWNWYQGETAHSPLLKRRQQNTAITSLSYRFG